VTGEVPAQTPASDHTDASFGWRGSGPTQQEAAPGASLAQALASPANGGATTISAAVTSRPHGRSGSPAEQVAPTLLTLAKATDGSQQMTVRLTRPT